MKPERETIIELNEAGLDQPPSGKFPKPAIETLEQVLPFGQLTWENFERLCYQLAKRTGQVEAAFRYGRQGQAQGGIDVYARKSNGKYNAWQAKRYRKYTVANLKSAVAAFRKGSWFARSDRLYLAVQDSLEDVGLQEEIERQTSALAQDGVEFEPLGGDKLSDMLRDHPDLVHSFFGRSWTVAFFGKDVDHELAASLDGEEFDRVRAQLHQVYRARFNALDPGVATTAMSRDSSQGSPPPGILERYTIPDVAMRSRQTDFTEGSKANLSMNTVAIGGERQEASGRTSTLVKEVVRRVPVTEWLAEGDQLAVVADAGAGKSTLLRCIALDLLGNQTAFPDLAKRWGLQLPIFIPFARWARETKNRGGELGLKDLVSVWLQPLLTVDLISLVNRALDERRVVLLIDGLDEWAAEQSARVAFHTLLTLVDVHNIPVVASGRPNGIQKIGTIPHNWKNGELAPLSIGQQRQIAQTWFSYQSHRLEADKGAVDATNWRANRFLSELKQDGGLAELAATPLMLMGLLALAIRQVTLPRNRRQALQDVVRILLEIHPQGRATAAGDVEARFVHAASLELRENAISALAYACRRDGGDAGYPLESARTAITDHLRADTGLDAAQSSAIAAEILAINAETVGLLIEKAPGEIGFAHASLEEFLSAKHVQSWPLQDLLGFVEANVGNSRWRNTLRNLVSLNPRANEIEQIIKVIEGVALDTVGDLNRRQLLAEIAFSPSAIRSDTAHRLAQQAFETVEGASFDSERIDMARIVLTGLGDPTLGGVIESRVARWSPRRFKYGSSEFSNLGVWPKSAELLSLLWWGLLDEERYVQASAVKTLAKAYGGNEEIYYRLRELVAGNGNHTVVGGAIEAILRGWPDMPVDDLLEQCAASRSPDFQAVAIFGKVKKGQHGDEDLKACLRLLSYGSPLPFGERELAREALHLGWPSDERVIAESLNSFGMRSIGVLEHDVAAGYLSRCSPDVVQVREWILEELEKEFPFNGLWGRSREFLVPFAQRDARIVDKVVSVLENSKVGIIEHDFWQFVAGVKDDRLRDWAIARFKVTKGTSQYWALLPLVRGWEDDAKVKELLPDVAAIPDEDLHMLVALVPSLYATPAEARQRLLRIARQSPKKARRDLLCSAFIEVGATAEDDEVVEALLAVIENEPHAFNPIERLFIDFAAHPKVRDRAMHSLKQSAPPLSALIFGYRADEEMRTRLSSMLMPASASVRYVIAEACAIYGDRYPVLLEVLNAFDSEVDFDLKVQLAIYCGIVQAVVGDTEAFKAKLKIDAFERGMNFEDARSAAFAGLLRIGAVAEFEIPEDVGRQVKLKSLLGNVPNAELCSLIVERWADLKDAFGENWMSQIISGDNGPAWDALAPYVSRNSAARIEFVEWASETKGLPRESLRTLSVLSPGSDVLRRHVASALSRTDFYDDDYIRRLITAAEIAHDQFSGGDFAEKVEEQFYLTGHSSSAVALAILDRENHFLKKTKRTAREVGEQGDWLSAAYLTALLDTPAAVRSYICGLADREHVTGYEGHLDIVATLLQRIAGDAKLTVEIRDLDLSTVSVDAVCAFAGFLAEVSALNDEWRIHCSGLLEAEQSRSGLPTIVLDVFTNQFRPLSHVVLNVLQAPGNSS